MSDTAHARLLPTSSTERVHRHRAREKAGHALLTVEVEDLTAVADFLAERGFLPPWGSDDRVAVARALATALAVWSRR